MLLETSIKPRRDGSVVARLPDETGYTFMPGEDGTLSCEVTDDAHVAWLVGTGNFYPANQADFDAATELVSDEVPGDEGVGEPDDTGDEDAPVIEEPVMKTHKSRKAK